MIGKIIGAIVGQRAAQHVSGVSGPGGVILGAGAAAVARRLGPVGLIAAGVGGYLLKRHYDKRQSPPRPAPKPYT